MTVDPALRHLVRRRAAERCEYCRVSETLDPLPFQVDHIIARKHRGASDETNLAWCCFACNNHKGPNIAGVDPRTGNVVSLFHPRKHRWDEHFRWDGAALVGLTPSGRATVIVLEINLRHRVSFRKTLREEGVFPPEP